MRFERRIRRLESRHPRRTLIEGARDSELAEVISSVEGTESSGLNDAQLESRVEALQAAVRRNQNVRANDQEAAANG